MPITLSRGRSRGLAGGKEKEAGPVLVLTEVDGGIDNPAITANTGAHQDIGLGIGRVTVVAAVDEVATV